MSDIPDQTREVNERLEAELKQLKVDFSVTEPMASWWSKVTRKPRTRRIGAGSSGS